MTRKTLRKLGRSKLEQLGLNLGQAVFHVIVNVDGKAEYDKIKAKLEASTLKANYWYPPNDDWNARIEVDAYTFAEKEEVDDRKK
jgi:hypothetical protein